MSQDTGQLARPEVSGDSAVEVFRPTARQRRLLRATCSLLDQGKAPTEPLLAAELGITPEAVANMRARPGVAAWLDEQLQEANGHLVGLVVRRVAGMALEGKVTAAELFLRVTGQLGTEGQAGAGTVVNVQVVGVAAPAEAKAWPGGTLEGAKVSTSKP